MKQLLIELLLLLIKLLVILLLAVLVLVLLLLMLLVGLRRRSVTFWVKGLGDVVTILALRRSTNSFPFFVVCPWSRISFLAMT